MSAAVETWKEMWCGAEFQCFRDERGETFHFRKAQLMRGKPSGPYNTIEEYTRPAHLLTLENAFNVSGISIVRLKYFIKYKRLSAIRKRWRYGIRQRAGLLVDIRDLRELMARLAIAKHLRVAEWDVDASELLK